MQVFDKADARELRIKYLDADLAIAGGGLSGVCAAITAAREGLKVVLVQDRPVLGGNASSEVRLWGLGATSHLGNNNRWAREGGVINEIMVENLYRNKEGNPLLFDTVLLDKVVREPNITLLLNTAVFAAEKSDDRTIRMMRGFCAQNSTLYEIAAPLFCDASGDGILGYLAGASHRIGAEDAEEFDEKFAPDPEYGELLGHSIFFYSKDTGKPVKFVKPDFALNDITKIPRYRNFTKDETGCSLWWIEYGGRLDTIHDSEEIKWELWRIVYAVWDYIKNSGNFPGSETMTLEWVGHIPGKRESRRFEGDTMMVQKDIVEQRTHYDAVSFGGWAIDLHPADGVYANRNGCDQWHSKGVYQIPYRSMYSRDIDNLFLAGRIISATHIAHGSTRVMMTCAHGGQAVAVAAALCKEDGLKPRDLSAEDKIGQLQQRLLGLGQYIPGHVFSDKMDLVRQAELEASSTFKLDTLPADGPFKPLIESAAMLVPVEAGKVPEVSFQVLATEKTQLRCELRICSRTGSFTPDTVVESRVAELVPVAETATIGVSGDSSRRPGPSLQDARFVFEYEVDEPQYIFFCLMENPAVSVALSESRVTGVLSVSARADYKVAKDNIQRPDRDIGVDTLEFWIPDRWPAGRNLAMGMASPIELFGVKNISNGINRPVLAPNAWVADPRDEAPAVTLQWAEAKRIRRIELCFDTDWDHPMESVLMGHPCNVIPFCVRDYRILDGEGNVIHECAGNYQTRNSIVLENPVFTDALRFELTSPSANVPAALFEIRCYE
jgi:hypothetical protein